MEVFYGIIEFAAIAAVFATLATILISCSNEENDNNKSK